MQCIQYLHDDVETSCPAYKTMLKEVFENYDFDVFKNLCCGMMEMLINLVISDVECTKIFINKIIAHKINASGEVYGIPNGTKYKIGEMLDCVSWEEVKNIVESVIENIRFSQYVTWMDVFPECGIVNIANKVIDLTLQKFRSFKSDHYLSDTEKILLKQIF